jgi:release factor glutamine methyltransferase
MATATDLLSSIPDLPRHEVERLLLAATGLRRHHLLAGGEIDGDGGDRFLAMVGRRRKGEPLQYIEGSVSFGPLELAIDPRALVPRPETEQLWDLLVRRLRPAPRVVIDLCTGSGNLALACKHAWPGATVVATDISPDAVALARENAVRTGLDITVEQGDLFAPVPAELAGSVDLVVANPPYLAAAELDVLAAEVRDHEPHGALVAGETGTEILARIATEVGEWLRPGGTVACEISEFHPDRVAALFAAYTPEILPDLTARPRFLLGHRRGGGGEP